MRTLAVGLWKEWRDHRLVSVALLVALPVLVFASAWAFGDELPPHAFGGLTLYVLNAAQALYVLSVASESFGSERRRGTLDLLRRLPRGLTGAFAAKVGAYVLGNAVALAWGAAVAWTACRLFGPARASADLAAFLVQPDTLMTSIALALFVLGLWTLLLSNLIPQGGAATVGAALLLGLLGLPAFLALKDRPWLVQLPDPDTIRMALLGLGALGFVALAYAFLRGNRLLASAWSPAWRGLAVVGVVATGGYAWGAVALERALTIEPTDEEFHIAEAYLGTGARYLHLTVYRGTHAYFQEHHSSAGGTTPHQPWIVDLADGSWRVAGDWFEGWQPLVWNNRHAAQPIVKRYAYTTSHVAWFDGQTAELRKVLPHDVRTPEVLAWQRSAMPALAWHRDEQGRALWLEGERLMREGDAAPTAQWSLGESERWYEPVPGGWLGSGVVWDKQHRNPRVIAFLMDAATGRSTPFERHPPNVHEQLVLSPRTALRRTYGRTASGQRGKLGPWSLFDIESGALTPAKTPPTALVRALPLERALVLAGADRRRLVLSTWYPRTGRTAPMLDEHGEPFVGVAAEVAAAAPGLCVVRVADTGNDYPKAAFALIEEATGRARRLPMNDSRGRVVCIENKDSIVALTPGSKVVRFRYSTTWVGRPPAFGLEVLFPR
jgi:hypothetical protein